LASRACVFPRHPDFRRIAEAEAALISVDDSASANESESSTTDETDPGFRKGRTASVRDALVRALALPGDAKAGDLPAVALGHRS
jgi:hypothetical protein